MARRSVSRKSSITLIRVELTEGSFYDYFVPSFIDVVLSVEIMQPTPTLQQFSNAVSVAGNVTGKSI